MDEIKTQFDDFLKDLKDDTFGKQFVSWTRCNLLDQQLHLLVDTVLSSATRDTLEELDLNHALVLTHTALPQVVRLLDRCARLAKLDLEACNLQLSRTTASSPDDDDSSAIVAPSCQHQQHYWEFLKALQRNKTLKYLSLSGCGLSEEAVILLLDALLETNSTLEQLHLTRQPQPLSGSVLLQPHNGLPRITQHLTHLGIDVKKNAKKRARRRDDNDKLVHSLYMHNTSLICMYSTARKGLFFIGRQKKMKLLFRRNRLRQLMQQAGPETWSLFLSQANDATVVYAHLLSVHALLWCQ